MGKGHRSKNQSPGKPGCGDGACRIQRGVKSSATVPSPSEKYVVPSHSFRSSSEATSLHTADTCFGGGGHLPILTTDKPPSPLQTTKFRYKHKL